MSEAIRLHNGRTHFHSHWTFALLKIPPLTPVFLVFISLKIVASITTNHEEFLTFSKNGTQIIWGDWCHNSSWSSGMSPVTHSPCCQIHDQGCVLSSDPIKVPRWVKAKTQDNWMPLKALPQGEPVALPGPPLASYFPVEQRHGDMVCFAISFNI